MLIELFGRNFGPFRDEFHLSMLATDIDPGTDRGVVNVSIEGEDEPLRLLRCAAVYGPNASGKSRLLLAARAVGHLIERSADFTSDDPLRPYDPFLLDEKSATAPVMLGIRGVIGRSVYEYVIEFEKTRFVLETLTQLAPGEKRVLFERHEQSVTGPWVEESQFALLARAFRPNAALLSLAERLAPSLDCGLALRIRRLLGYPRLWDRPPDVSAPAARRAARDRAGFGTFLLNWLRAADVGIQDYTVEKLPVADQPVVGTERAPRRRRDEFKLTFAHSGLHGPVGLDYYQESLGTLEIVELAPYIHDLIYGDELRAFFIDEIGASVHPVLLQALIRQFNCETPPESIRGQLIFATHETLVLDAEAKSAPLRRDQVYLTEKDATGASRLYSIAEFKERNNLNLRRRYLQGRYGALPSPGRWGE